jgi:hypothetical protein
MGALVIAFPDRDFDMEIYWEFLRDLDDFQFLKAVRDFITTRKELYPSSNPIALLRELALNGTRLIGGEAWGEVMREISRTGSRGSPKFSSPLIGKAVDCIGWNTICQSQNISVERAHFLKIYDSLAERERNDHLLLPSRMKTLIEDATPKGKT